MSTTNYFVVPGFRIVPPLFSVVEDASVTAETVLQKKIARIVGRKQLPVDWTRYFFFDDEDPSSTLRAYEAAKKAGLAAAFRVPRCSGPWSTVRVIGQFPKDDEAS